MASKKDLKPANVFTRKNNAEKWKKKFTKLKAQAQQSNNQLRVAKYTKKLQGIENALS